MHVHRLGLRNLRDVRVVDVSRARTGQLRTGRQEDFQRRPVVEREAVVTARLRVPEVDHLAQLLRLIGREVMQLGSVDIGVVQLPRVVVEVAPAAQRRVGGDRLPAVMPDATGAEHRVELGLAGRRLGRLSEARAHAHAIEMGLGVALDSGRRLDPQQVQHGRHDVHRVVVLRPGSGRRPPCCPAS